ncbi:MAG: hypothetical protein F6K24_12645 [Okeania sp. SIO2D1]|nr:hypothetical protein [Okeania sp. SIO2D1]
MMQPIKAERATVKFFEGLTVDGYRMPNGEFRVGLEGASIVIGYSKQWLSQVLNSRPRTLKALTGLGFTASQMKVQVGREGKRGISEAETICLRDFNRIILYAASKGKKAAIALQLSLTEVALNDFFVDAFGEPPLTISQKRELFYRTYAASISPEDWRNMDREEIIKLALPGDEPHLKNGLWNEKSED